MPVRVRQPTRIPPLPCPALPTTGNRPLVRSPLEIAFQDFLKRATPPPKIGPEVGNPLELPSNIHCEWALTVVIVNHPMSCTS